MGLTRFSARNHPQQTRRDDIDARATTGELFAEISAMCGGPFTLDVAASADNTKCERFFDQDTDGLAQPWTGERVWCNPPYSRISAWVTKAWAEHAAVEMIAMLLPANRTEQSWWQDMIEPFRDRPGSPLSLRFLANRRRFIRSASTFVDANERPPFGVCTLVWSGTGPVAYVPPAALFD